MMYATIICAFSNGRSEECIAIILNGQEITEIMSTPWCRFGFDYEIDVKYAGNLCLHSQHQYLPVKYDLLLVDWHESHNVVCKDAGRRS
jgi:hypothetical protein